MEEIERITNVKNSVGAGIGIVSKVPYALKTSEQSVYRVTGMDQIQDIIECGYVRPKGYGPRRERVGDKIYWSIGGNGLNYIDRRPVIEAPIEKVLNGQIGAIPLYDLTAIWIFNEEISQYINQIEFVKGSYNNIHIGEDNILKSHRR